MVSIFSLNHGSIIYELLSTSAFDGTIVAHLVLDVDVEVALHGPHVLVAVAGRRQDLEPDVPQRVQDHHGAG